MALQPITVGITRAVASRTLVAGGTIVARGTAVGTIEARGTGLAVGTLVARPANAGAATSAISTHRVGVSVAVTFDGARRWDADWGPSSRTGANIVRRAALACISSVTGIARAGAIFADRTVVTAVVRR